MSSKLPVIAFPGAPNLPLFVAMERGLFESRDLDVTLTITPSSVYQFEQLSSGAFSIGMTAFDNIVAYRENQGATDLKGINDFVAIMGATQIELSFVVAPDIGGYSDLAGKSVALDALSTGFAFVLYEMLARNGLTTESVEFSAVGATPERWQSVKTGEHAGTLTIEPFTSVARAAGFTVLDTSSRILDAYQGGVICCSRKWAAQFPEIVSSFLGGYIEALEWTLEKLNYEDAKRILLDNMPAIKPAVADAVMGSVLAEKSGLTPEGAFLDDGMRTVLKLRSSYGAGVELTDLDRYVDRSIMQKLIPNR